MQEIILEENVNIFLILVLVNANEKEKEKEFNLVLLVIFYHLFIVVQNQHQLKLLKKEMKVSMCLVLNVIVAHAIFQLTFRVCQVSLVVFIHRQFKDKYYAVNVSGASIPCNDIIRS